MKILQPKKFPFLYESRHFFICRYTKNVQAARDAFSPQKHFFTFLDHFCPPSSRSGSSRYRSTRIRIRIHNTDQVHGWKGSGTYLKGDVFISILVERGTCVSACEAVLHPSLAEGAHGALLRLQPRHHLQQAQVYRGGVGHTTSVADPGCLSRIMIFIHPGSNKTGFLNKSDPYG